MTQEQSDLEAAITSSRNAYFAHRAHMQPTPAFLQLFADAFALGADYARESAPQLNAALADGWVRVDERLPESGEAVLGSIRTDYIDASSSQSVTLMVYDGWGGWGEYRAPTHWMSLPFPPEFAEEGVCQ